VSPPSGASQVPGCVFAHNHKINASINWHAPNLIMTHLLLADEAHHLGGAIARIKAPHFGPRLPKHGIVGGYLCGGRRGAGIFTGPMMGDCGSQCLAVAHCKTSRGAWRCRARRVLPTGEWVPGVVALEKLEITDAWRRARGLLSRLAWQQDCDVAGSQPMEIPQFPTRFKSDAANS
jgi:hypothetical protein